jgi:hypothetical protein
VIDEVVEGSIVDAYGVILPNEETTTINWAAFSN